VGDPLAAARGADGLLILTPWPEYRAIKPADIAGALTGRIVIDPYSVLDPAGMQRSQLIHYTLGRPVAH
jgi:UDPglucose 6-dehydrogenase